MTIVTLCPSFNTSNAMKSCRDKILPGDHLAVQNRNTPSFFSKKVSSGMFFIKKVSFPAVFSVCLIPAVLIPKTVSGNGGISEQCGSDTS